jgi:hypothetical protein
MTYERGKQNGKFLGVVYHVEGNRIHSVFLYTGRLVTEADMQYAKRVF